MALAALKHAVAAAVLLAPVKVTVPAGVSCVHATDAAALKSTGPPAAALPAQKGMEELPDLKSWGLPMKSQRSANSLVPLILSTVSLPYQGWPVSTVTMELSSQP